MSVSISIMSVVMSGSKDPDCSAGPIRVGAKTVARLEDGILLIAECRDTLKKFKTLEIKINYENYI